MYINIYKIALTAYVRNTEILLAMYLLVILGNINVSGYF